MRSPLRIVLLLVIAAAVGALAAVQITSALRARDAYPRGVMDVMAQHAGALDDTVRTQRCAANATARNFAMLETMSGEIPLAFPDLMRDARFAKFATDAHALDKQLAAAPPAECTELRKALAQVGQHCDQCHQEYR